MLASVGGRWGADADQARD